jgi:ribosomal protein S18 acetylase RimI-like enzyme
MGNKEHLILLAQKKEKLIGFIGLMTKYNNKKVSKKININNLAYIAWIAVLPEFRNKKIGSKLLKKAEQIAKKWGKNGIWLSCKKDIIEFYKNNNYKLKGYFIKQYKRKKFRKYYLIKKIT